MQPPVETSVNSGDASAGTGSTGTGRHPTTPAVSTANAPAPPGWGSDDALSEFPTEEEVREVVPPQAPSVARQTTRTWTLPAAAVLLIVVAGAAWLWRATARAPGPSAPVTGTLSIESTPPGAQVVIDGRERGATPLTLPLGSGRHEVLLRTSDASRTIDVSVAAGSQVVHHVELAKAVITTGRLHVSSNPAAAAVVLDGTPRGITPIDVADVAAGDHTITVGDGIDAVTQRVTVPAGGVASLVVPLGRSPREAPGWISVQAPVELQVYEGNTLVGTSRSDRIMVLSGRHSVRLSNPALEFETMRTIQVERGRVTTLQMDMPNGALNVNAVPWAEVLLDGRRIGETPIANFRVPIGPHDVVLRNPKFPEVRRSVVVTLSTPARVGVDLRQ